MKSISSYVFLDIETTGFPWQEKNQTKITELCFIVVSRKDIEGTTIGAIPPVGKLSLTFNPQKLINKRVTEITGLTNNFLKYSPTFKEKVKTIISFLEDLPKPVCLVAHNGDVFDYKILLAEFNDAKISLPSDLLCVDSLIGFKKLLNEPVIDTASGSCNSSFADDLLTDDDDDEWPDLDVSADDWKHIDELSTSMTKTYLQADHVTKSKNFKSINKRNQSKTKGRVSYKLSDIYERLLTKVATNAHRAEFDCIMLLECVIAKKDVFLPWADNNSKLLSEINALRN